MTTTKSVRTFLSKLGLETSCCSGLLRASTCGDRKLRDITAPSHRHIIQHTTLNVVV